MNSLYLFCLWRRVLLRALSNRKICLMWMNIRNWSLQTSLSCLCVPVWTLLKFRPSLPSRVLFGLFRALSVSLRKLCPVYNHLIHKPEDANIRLSLLTCWKWNRSDDVIVMLCKRLTLGCERLLFCLLIYNLWHIYVSGSTHWDMRCSCCQVWSFENLQLNSDDPCLYLNKRK